MKNIYNLIIALVLIFMTNNLYSQYSLWTWGSNHNGQLGNDRAEDAPTPILINDDGEWEKVYSYYAIKKDGTLWTWGNGEVNLINREIEDTSIRLFDDSKWEKIFTSSHGRTTYGIKQDGSLWSWGIWHRGWIITEHTDNSNVPILIDGSHDWEEVEVDDRFILAIDDKGFLFSWGHFISLMGIGELEDPDDDMIDKITRVGNSNKWKKISSLFFQRTFGIQEDGSLWSWGGDSDGLIDTVNKNYYEPIKLGDYDCVDIRTNYIGTLFTNSKGEIYSIGKLNSVVTTKPNKLTYGADNIKFIETGDRCFALKHKDFCIFLGENAGLRFGPDAKDSYYSNFIGPYFETMRGFKDIAQIGNGFIFIDSLNNLMAWGDNSNGELGNGRSSNYQEPFQLLPSRTFSDVSCGENYSLAIDEYGMMWAWGSNYMNVLGIDDIDDFNKPILVDYEVDWEKVYTFGNSNFATKIDGTLWAWGENEYGQLGVGHNKPVLTPTKIEEYGPWKLIHSNSTYNSGHTLALKEDGSLWVWGTGKRELGLGLGTKETEVFKPTKVNDETDWTDIGCGDGFSVAIKSDMSYWCWGGNQYGVFGDYEGRAYDIPTLVNLKWAKQIVQISSSNKAVLALNNGGFAYLFAPSVCGAHDSFSGDPSSLYIYSNYKGYNAIITEEQELYVATSSPSSGGLDYLKLVNTGYRQAAEGKDWVKATIGREHILALRGEKTTNVKEPRKLVNANVYPNPSVSNINIDFDSFYNNISLSIYDVYGKLVLESSLSNTDKISINHNLSQGAYILQCRDGNSLIVDQVLVVE